MKITVTCIFLSILIIPIIIDAISEWCDIHDKLRDTEYRLWKLEKVVEKLLVEIEQREIK